MYTPLEFMNSIPKFYRVANNKKISDNISKTTFNTAIDVVSKAPEMTMFMATKTLAKIVREMPKGQAIFIPNCVNLKVYDIKAKHIADYPYSPQFFLHCALYDDWMKHKSVYKVEKSLVREFVNMEIPKRGIPIAALSHLPATSMYIDVENTGVFCDEIKGVFLYHYELEDMHYFHMTTLARTKSTLLPLHVAMGFSNKDEGDFADTEVDKLPKVLLLRIKDWECLYEERALVRMVLNFAQYLYAANRDVEYIERTHVSGKRSKKKIQEASVNEARVGYRIANTISQSKVKIRYTKRNSEKDPDAPTRNYSSHFRSAHWHHYWVGPKDAQKLIVKWVMGTYVKGNVETDAVKVTKVVK